MLPALVVLGLGLPATDSLVISQVVLSFGIPFALVPLVLLTRRADVMGALVNRPAHHRGGGRHRRHDHRPERLPALGHLRPVTAGGRRTAASRSLASSPGS